MSAEASLSLPLLPPVVAVGEAGRRTNDAYFTAPALAEHLVSRLQRDDWWRGGSVLEPSAGRGAFVRAVRRLSPVPELVHANDMDPIRVQELRETVEADVLTQQDFLALPEAHFDLVIGNPPYAMAQKHTEKALAMRSRFGIVAFLLRLGFLESQERMPFWAEHPPSKVFVLSERPSFTGGGTDNSAYGFFLWAPWHRGPTELEVISWRQ